MKLCKKCSKEFEELSGHQKYCDDCLHLIVRENYEKRKIYSRESKRKKKEEKRIVTIT